MPNPFFILGIILLLFIIVVILWSKRKSISLQPNGIGQQTRLPANGTEQAGSYPFELVCIGGPMQGKRYAFQNNFLLIGREPENHICLEGELISRRHATVYISNNGAILRDLDSSNGTYDYLGRRIAEISLTQNQPFQIGNHIFSLVGIGQPYQPVQQAPISSRHENVSHAPIQPIALHHYDRLEVIGEGGAATVFLCENKSSKQKVAIKVLQQIADPYFKEKFKSEGDVGKRLLHPHIIKTLDYGQSGGHNFIVLEYLAGGSLRDRLNLKTLSLDEIVQITGHLCMALEYAHRQGIFHRDIKPENILYANTGIVKLADFGIARLTSARTVTRAGMLVGTPDYMSYEQARGLPVDGQSDQYSLAIVLFEMLVGFRPFEGEPLSVVGKHLKDPPPSIRKIDNAIPSYIENVVVRALQKEKKKRFHNMLEMAEALNYQPDPQTLHLTQNVSNIHSNVTARLINLKTNEAILLKAPSAIIGRSNLQVDNDYMSLQHARIYLETGSFVLQDMGSRNGTFVNGILVKRPVRLLQNSQVMMGKTEFLFQIN